MANRKQAQAPEQPEQREKSIQNGAGRGQQRPPGQPARNPGEESQNGKKLRNLAANMLFGLALVDDQLRVLRFNDKFKGFFSAQAASGSLLCDILQRGCSVPDGCDNCPVLRSLKSGANNEREFARSLPGGTEQSFRFVASPAKVASPPKAAASGPESSADAARGLQALRGGLVLVLIEDITRKRIIEQKLLRAQRLEAMSTLAGGIAHEINQPLSALNLYASGLKILLDKQELPPPEVIRERVGLILDQAQKISEITQHMRAMAIQSAAVYEEVDVEAVLRGVLLAMRESFENYGIEVELRAPAGLPRVKAIGVQLNQALSNLLSNAVHAIRKRQAEEPGAPKLVRISATLDKQRVLVEVADSGAGILPGQERRIFDPFYTTKGPSDGMGLGLSLVHAFIRSWGGEVQVRGKHPELGGASFEISLNLIVPGGSGIR